MKVTSIKKGKTLTVDLSIEDTYSYQLSNGVVVHNSLKGILEYNDKKKESEAKEKEILYIDRRVAPERPKDLDCDIHQVVVQGERYIILIGKLNGTLYELFVTDDKEKSIDFEKHKNGVIRKINKGRYDLLFVNGEEKTFIQDIGNTFGNDTYRTLARFVSMSLRHGTPLQFIVGQLQKDKNFLGFERSVARTLKKYIKEGEKVITSDKCPECGADMIYIEGCKTCSNRCGYAKCD